MTRFLAAVALFLPLSAALAQEKVDNPEYKTWVGLKPGTAVKYKMITESGGMKNEVKLTNVLVELLADKAVVETTTTFDLMGKEIKNSTKHEVTKQLEKTKGVLIPGVDKPDGTYEEGTEDFSVGTAKVKTKWYKYKTEKPVAASGQIWLSEEVPGGLVKLTTKSSAPTEGSMTMELLEIEKK